jgi:SepF-like predicted cell division protein (DUF552 family)
MSNFISLIKMSSIEELEKLYEKNTHLCFSQDPKHEVIVNVSKVHWSDDLKEVKKAIERGK